MKVKNIILGVVALAVIVLGFMVFARQPTPSLGAVASGDFLNPVTFYAGKTEASVNSTSTPASMTLRVSDVQNKDTVVVLQTVAVGVTLTTFASTTAAAKAFLPVPGQRQNVCFLNATSTAGATLTFAAGTGNNIYVASSTAGSGSYIINPGRTACFTVLREPTANSTTASGALDWFLTNFI